MRQLIENVLHAASSKGDHAYVGGGLILAGLYSTLFTSQNLQVLYFALLIPPAAYHCFLTAKKYFFPPVVKVVKPIVKKIIVPVVIKVIPPVIKDNLYVRVKAYLSKLYNTEHDKPQ